MTKYRSGTTGKFISDSEAKEILKSLKRVSDFGYSGKLDMFNTWSLGPVLEHRDSGLLDQSNSAEITKRLESHPEYNDQWENVHCSHWAVGWLDHLSYQVIKSNINGVITFAPIVDFIRDIYASLENYPILNEEDYSSREFESTVENIRDAVRYFVRRIDQDVTLPDQYEYILYSWFGENDPAAIESDQDQGGYPDDDQLSKAFILLRWL